MSDPDNPEAFVRQFVDKDLGVTFHIHQSGSDGAVYASPPFRHDYIVYSDDKELHYCSMNSARRDCPGKDDTTKCLGHPTRTFIGYLRQEGPDWLAFDKSGRSVPGEFDRQETAAYAIYRANQQRVISKHKAQGKRRVESIVNKLLEADMPSEADNMPPESYLSGVKPFYHYYDVHLQYGADDGGSTFLETNLAPPEGTKVGDRVQDPVRAAVIAFAVARGKVHVNEVEDIDYVALIDADDYNEASAV